MPEQQEIVIVADDGTEHVFPAGFDPKRAAAIVRGEPQPKSVKGFLGNVASSGGKFVGDIASALTSPVETGKGLFRLAKGTAQLAIPGEQGDEAVPRALGQHYKERYGGLSNIGETLYNDPVGALADVSTVLGGVGAPLKLAGAASKIKGLQAAGKAAQVAGDLTNPIRAVTAPMKLAGRELGMGVTGMTVRPGTTLVKEAGGGIAGKRRIAREITEKGLFTEERAQANLGKAIDASQQTVKRSGATVPRAAVTDVPKTLNTVMDRAGSVQESAKDLFGLQDRVMRDLPANVPADKLFDVYKNWNRAAAGLFSKSRKEMPGGPDPVEGLGYREMLGNARSELFKIPELANQQKAVQTAMLAKGAMETAGARPHALTRILALGAGMVGRDPATTAAILLSDAPRLGSGLGHLVYRGGNQLDAAAITRAMILARLQEQLAGSTPER